MAAFSLHPKDNKCILMPYKHAYASETYHPQKVFGQQLKLVKKIRSPQLLYALK